MLFVRRRLRLFVIINLTVVNGPFYILFPLCRATAICHPDVHTHAHRWLVYRSIPIYIYILLCTRVVNHGQHKVTDDGDNNNNT